VALGLIIPWPIATATMPTAIAASAEVPAAKAYGIPKNPSARSQLPAPIRRRSPNRSTSRPMNTPCTIALTRPSSTKK
jgi:hypothetical protein